MCDLTYIGNLKNKQNNENQLIDTENKEVVSRGKEGGRGNIDKGDSEGQTSSSKISKPWRLNAA